MRRGHGRKEQGGRNFVLLRRRRRVAGGRRNNEGRPYSLTRHVATSPVREAGWTDAPMETAFLSQNSTKTRALAVIGISTSSPNCNKIQPEQGDKQRPASWVECVRPRRSRREKNRRGPATANRRDGADKSPPLFVGHRTAPNSPRHKQRPLPRPRGSLPVVLAPLFKSPPAATVPSLQLTCCCSPGVSLLDL